MLLLEDYQEVSKIMNTKKKNWSLPQHFPILKHAMCEQYALFELNDKNNGIPTTSEDFMIDILLDAVPPKTVRNSLQKLNELGINPKDDFTVDDLFNFSHGHAGLLSSKQLLELSVIIIYHDHSNRGMSRQEIIRIIHMIGGVDLNVADNHYTYLLHHDKLPKLKRGSCVVKTQATIIKCSQMTAEQQLCWHSLVEETWMEQKQCNTPQEEFCTMNEFFILNLDETYIQANGDNLMVVRIYMIPVSQSQE